MSSGELVDKIEQMVWAIYRDTRMGVESKVTIDFEDGQQLMGWLQELREAINEEWAEQQEEIEELEKRIENAKREL